VSIAGVGEMYGHQEKTTLLAATLLGVYSLLQAIHKENSASLSELG
jgi:hypothetical protein